MRARLIHLGLAAIMLLSGCTSWFRLADGRPVPTRGTIEVWSSGQKILLRDARTVGDSLEGPGAYPDTTRRSIATSEIDSIRIQTLDPGKMLIVGTGLAMAAVFVIASSFPED
ncbi:MAG TPA: hypothetical protein VFH26_03510 [Gemmatimonadales bacterium]|nr:hypothetical protein [Gemmatimonadales bacterium]